MVRSGEVVMSVIEESVEFVEEFVPVVEELVSDDELVVDEVVEVTDASNSELQNQLYTYVNMFSIHLFEYLMNLTSTNIYLHLGKSRQ